MEDVEFNESHSNSPLPEAGHDPGDPQNPELEEENAIPNPPIGDPDQDMEVTEEKAEMPDQDDIEEAGLSDNESALSELDDQQFDDFDAANISIEERPQAIDEDNVGLIGVHKRKRTEGEGEQPKKKKKKDSRRDKPRRKKNRDEEVSGGDELGSRKSRRRKEAPVRAASPDEEDDDQNLTPEERKCGATFGLVKGRPLTSFILQVADEHLIARWTRLSKLIAQLDGVVV